MEKTFTVYCHTNKINGKKYIGITNKKPEHRWNNGKGYSTQTVFARAIEKYGWENFDHTILDDNISTLEEANKKERYYISLYHTWLGDENCNGYNKTPGGDSRDTVSDELRIKYGQARLGKKLTEEHKDKLKKSCTGIKHTESAKQKITENNKISVKCVELNQTFDSAKDAIFQLALPKTCHISECLKGKRATAGGYHWEYADKTHREPHKVICIELNKTFDSADDAGKFVNRLPGKIREACNNPLKIVGKYHWKYIN